MNKDKRRRHTVASHGDFQPGYQLFDSLIQTLFVSEIV